PAVHHRQGGRPLLVSAGALAVLPLLRQWHRVQEFGGGHGTRRPASGAHGEEAGEEDGGAGDSGGARGGRRGGGESGGARLGQGEGRRRGGFR
ncbi:hypothetical protein C0991_011920, partial [Blastosporella zonata]